MAPRPRLNRIAGMAAIATLAFVSLSACIDVKADMTINSDAKATGTLSLEFQKQAASFMGITSLDDFQKGISSDDTTGGLAALTDCAASETDAAYVYSCTFADQEFASTGEAPWTITRDGDTIVMKVVNEQQSADTGSQDLLGDASLGSLAISATFPGPITEVTGAGATKTSDDTVKIEASLTDAVDVTVVSDVSTAGALTSVLVIVGIIAAVGIIALVVIVLIMRRRGHRDEADVVVVEAPVEPATDEAPAEPATDEAPAEPATEDEPTDGEPKP